MTDLDDLIALERMAGALVASLSSAERRGLLRAIARDLRKSQSDRIAAQRNPDGSAYEKRAARREEKPGSYPVRFLYPKNAATPRLVFMKSWVRQGPLLTGFDTEKGAIRSFFWDKIDKWLPVESGDRAGGGKLRRRGGIKRKAMFRKLGRGKYLRAGASDLELWVGFSGAAARVAGIHQDGVSEAPAKNAKPIRYPRRVLIGLTAAERNHVLDALLAHVTSTIN